VSEGTASWHQAVVYRLALIGDGLRRSRIPVS